MKKQYRFDFGIGIAAEGFVKVTENMLFSEKTGFGLARQARSVLRRKGTRAYLQDFLLFQDNSFRLHLENGFYRIRLYSGDYEDEGDISARFYINGQEMSFWINDETVAMQETVVEVTEEMLELTAAETRHVCLNALEIALFRSGESIKVTTKVQVEEKKQKVTLCWTPEENATMYRVLRKNLQNGEIDKRAVVTGLIWQDAEVGLCGKYEYAVTPLDELEFPVADKTTVSVIVVDGSGEIGQVTDVTAISEKNRVILQWKGCKRAIKYRIYKKTPYGLNKLIGETQNCTYIDENVRTCVPFLYEVEAVTTAGLSRRTEVVSKVSAEKTRRWMETLDRGVAAVRNDKGVFISWRINAYEYQLNLGFLIYRNDKLLTKEPVTKCSCYLDREGKAGDCYTVKAVREGKAEKEGASVFASEKEYISVPLQKPEAFTIPDGNTYEYYARDVIPADLDGDGEYEFVVKWMANPRDNSHKGTTAVCYLDAYKMDGRKLWRICLGINVREGAHYEQVLVYDFDHDGKAEIICKTADGTKDSAGNFVGNPKADYRNRDGFVLEGEEYLSAFDGETGVLLDTVAYDPPRGTVGDWGDSWGNRVDRFLACVAYLDGENPSAVMCRGYYDHGRPTVLVAYDFIEKKLVKRWKFVADKNHNIEFTAQGNHNLSVGDIDGDGMDEIVYGAMAVDHDGTGIYSTGLGHGDGMHLGKFRPHGEGLDFFQIHEDSDAELGYEVRNPATGEIAWGYFTGRDTARGMCAKIDPRFAGNQVWAIHEQLYTFDGKMIEKNAPDTCKFPVWWDGDLLRELLDYIPDKNVRWNGAPVIYKWNWEKRELETVFKPEGARAIRGSKGTPCLQADILGDWREELVFTNEESTELRIYVSTELTEHRFYTLMHDPLYRLSVAWQNVAYNQPPHTGFYIGNEMEHIPIPESRYVRGENIPEFTEEI